MTNLHAHRDAITVTGLIQQQKIPGHGEGTCLRHAQVKIWSDKEKNTLCAQPLKLAG